MSGRAILAGYITGGAGDTYTLDLDPSYKGVSRIFVVLSRGIPPDVGPCILNYGTYEVIEVLPLARQSIQQAMADIGYTVHDLHGFSAVIATVENQRTPPWR